ncbi:CRP-like cAMP-binding protein [Virgibacillus campisalis]|uniref:CRP-like cAMP-binding protein n=1 Tax=Virgibacillus alimentarius TaxID=698769 RepID=A0ABS4SCW8_9BACI|nr:CRP-like cAMP-binding protein [Virgibacillus alimentarius]
MHNTYEQIIFLLLRLGNIYGKKDKEGKTYITTPFTNRELANMIGSSRETISRTMAQLKKKRLISIDKNGYLVLDTGALEKALF